MTGFEIGLIALAVMALLVLAGLHVPVALVLCSYAGVWAITGSSALASKFVALAANDAISNYFFGVVPLFVLMGFLVSEAGLGKDAYAVANRAFCRLKGGLAVGTVGANAIFAAVTGISIASAAVFTRIAVPEMIRAGYAPRFAVGVVAGSSVLGMLIPPSLLLILYGILAEQSIGDMFLAGIGPGIILALTFGVGIVAMAVFLPGVTGRPGPPEAAEMPLREVLAKAGPIFLLILVVLGGIYGGIFTPVEAGAVGSIAALAIGVVRGSLGWRQVWTVLVETGLVTAAVCFLIIAAQTYARMLALSGVPQGMANWAAGADLGFWGLMLAYIAVLILLGMVLDSSSILLIAVPLMLPVVIPMGLDLVWFGIVTVIAVEIGLLTPPFGISVFVIKSTLEDASITLGDIFRGAAPFAVMMFVVLLLVIAWPPLTLALVPDR